ncbi:unnamed protein product, partial [Larinioides sclopetarius]
MGTYCIKKANRWRKRSCFLSSVSFAFQIWTFVITGFFVESVFVAMGTYCIKKANRWRKRSCFLSSVSCSCVPVLKSSWLHDALKVAFQIWTFVITGFFVESVFVAMGTYCIKKAN